MVSGLTTTRSLQIPEKAESVELYDVIKDPNETTNLASSMPGRVERLKARLVSLLEEMVPARYSRGVRAGWPGRQEGENKGSYTTGWCDPVI